VWLRLYCVQVRYRCLVDNPLYFSQKDNAVNTWYGTGTRYRCIQATMNRLYIRILIITAFFMLLGFGVLYTTLMKHFPGPLLCSPDSSCGSSPSGLSLQCTLAVRQAQIETQDQAAGLSIMHVLEKCNISGLPMQVLPETNSVNAPSSTGPGVNTSKSCTKSRSETSPLLQTALKAGVFPGPAQPHHVQTEVRLRTIRVCAADNTYEMFRDRSSGVYKQVRNHTALHHVADDNGCKEAGVIVGTSKASLETFFRPVSNLTKTQFRLSYPNLKAIAIYTQEPRYSKSRSQCMHVLQLADGSSLRAAVVNCYVGGYFPSVFGFFYSATIQLYKRADVAAARSAKMFAAQTFDHRVFILNSYHKFRFRGVPEDLTWQRSQLGIYGHQHDFATVGGRGWPFNVAMENRYGSNASAIKLEAQQRFFFCLAMENTHLPNYVTEKLWDAIIAGCLPIYNGGAWIYQYFPENSFIDSSQFPQDERFAPAVYKFIHNISFDQWRNRMQLIQGAMERIIESNLMYKVERKYERAVKRISQIFDATYVDSAGDGCVV
jgi:Glycosyltransferase family 10 (fucosyltransferase) C-term